MPQPILAHEKEIHECEETILRIKNQNLKNPLWSGEEILHLEKKLEELKQRVYANLTPWDRVSISRHPARPHSLDYLQNLASDFEELFGDRSFADDHAVVGGLGRIGTEKVVLIGLEKGKDTESRIFRNFGMAHPEGYRKALRLMQLAEKFNLPVVTFLDTPGAYPGLSAEERGQGWAIAKNLFEMARLKTPLVVVLIGEGCSGGALGLGVGDKIGMLEHAYYSVISPEGCASILWKDASKNARAAAALKMQSEDLLGLGVIDTIIAEPLGGAHLDPALAYLKVKEFILQALPELKALSLKELVEKRYQKFRRMGFVSS
ncbi:MAG: acetyl-CoA carboxylase carboxyltransferase subunit alpha [Parachlamydiales bacterium]|jgi:acetyl-CoA carboxylase carboxyl transferase subunit alpha